MRRTCTALALLVTAAAPVLLVASPAAAGGGGCHTPGLSDAAATEVHMKQACFAPTVARVGVGDTVTFTNGDGMPHMVTGAGDTFGSYDEMLTGDTVSHTFGEAGVFPYYCLLHPGMVGAIVVDDAVAAGAASSGSTTGSLAGIAMGAGAVVTVAGLATARRRWRTVEAT